MNTDLYRDHILDHSRNPRHRGTLATYSFKERLTNPLCGDEIELCVTIDSAGTVTDLSFTGQGCVISQAAASLFCEAMQQKPSDAATELFALDLIGVPVNPARRSCALLPVRAFHKGLKQRSCPTR